jgi:hypothetical protein
MNSSQLDLVCDLPITSDHWDVPVPLEVRAYRRFCRGMDESLQELVARWLHLAAPCSTTSPVGSGGGSFPSCLPRSRRGCRRR